MYMYVAGFTGSSLTRTMVFSHRDQIDKHTGVIRHMCLEYKLTN